MKLFNIRLICIINFRLRDIDRWINENIVRHCKVIGFYITINQGLTHIRPLIKKKYKNRKLLNTYETKVPKFFFVIIIFLNALIKWLIDKICVNNR